MSEKSKLDEIDPKGCTDSVRVSLAPETSQPPSVTSSLSVQRQLTTNSRMIAFLCCIFAFYVVIAYLIHLSVETRNIKESDFFERLGERFKREHFGVEEDGKTGEQS